MIAQIFDSNAFKILAVMSLSRGSRFQRKELKERTRMNNVILDKSLQTLLNSGIIKKEDRYFVFNLENRYAKQVSEMLLQQYRDLKDIPLNVYFSITEIILFLSRFKLEVYLFGSYAKLIFKETSDIDLTVISDSINEHKKEISKFIQKIERKYGKTIELHYFGSDFYKNKKDPIVNEILKNGVKLI
ncbi:MAG: nucleotidyltransferase domain-containing protein [Candidatus Aenigmatarchaeota archaeon]